MRHDSVLLKLVVDAVGCRFTDRFTPNLKYIQNIIYLVQANGAYLGYLFKWSDTGACPYSIELNYRYYELKSDLYIGEKDYTWYQLTDGSHDAIETTRRLMIVPHDIPVNNSDWIAFLSAADYLYHSPHRPHDVKDEDIFNFLREKYDRISLINPHVVKALQTINDHRQPVEV